mmetsp:Transcript_2926/g.9268  ORF Transcript_2926/g.9268 Transcript_2926/m.9268 type:complete len:226 (+) Transcript_2926:66-743(+)
MYTNGEPLYPTAAMVTNAQTAWQALYPGEEVPQFETMQDFMAWAQTDPNQMRVRPGANNLPDGQPASALHWYKRTGGGVLDGGSAFSPDAQVPQSRQQAPQSRQQAPQSRQQAPVTAAADPVSSDSSPSFGERARGYAARTTVVSEKPPVAINWAVRLLVSDSEEASAHGVSRADSASSSSSGTRFRSTQRSADPTPPPSPSGAQADACPQLFRSTPPSQCQGGS